MYGFECQKKIDQGPCAKKRCLFPKVCKKLPITHQPQIELLKKVRSLPGVKKVFIASGIRYDMIAADPHGNRYLTTLINDHISGQMKVAPEHSQDQVLNLMGKPGSKELLAFKKEFDAKVKLSGKKLFLTYYCIAAHPGCTFDDMKKLKNFCSKKLGASPEQVQIFTPTPSTYSTLQYWTESDPATGKKIFVEKTLAGKEKQKTVLTHKLRRRNRLIR